MTRAASRTLKRHFEILRDRLGAVKAPLRRFLALKKWCIIDVGNVNAPSILGHLRLDNGVCHVDGKGVILDERKK